MTLKLRMEIELPDRSSDPVYFPNTGIISVVAVQERGNRVAVGPIGYEGMSGTAIVLADHRSPHSTYIQVAGAGPRFSVGMIAPR